MPETDLSQAIVDAAQAAEQVTVDGTTTTERSLSELIEADKYLRRRSAKGAPFNLIKVVPGGSA